MKYFSLLFFIVAISCSKKTMISPTMGSSMKADVTYLASDALEGRATGTEGELMASVYIAKRYKDLGLKAYSNNYGYFQDFGVKRTANPHSLEQDSDNPEIRVRNVVGFIDNGAKNNVVIGAHYDHLGRGGFGSLDPDSKEIHNGADDNASGVAIVLDLAKKLKSGSKKYNYIFIAFSGEEMGLWGSNHWVKNPNVDIASINYMVNLDMVGRLNSEQQLLINGTGTSPSFDALVDSENNYNFKLVKSASGMGPSDYSSFYNAGVPVLSFFTGQHEDYHKPTDDVEKINFEGMRSISNYIAGIMTTLNKKDKLAFSKTKDEEPSRMDFKVTLGVMPDYLYDGEGMRIDGVRDGRTASNAGIQKGDIVMKMGHVDVKDMMSYMEALQEFEDGQTIDIVIKRADKIMTKSATFGDPKAAHGGGHSHGHGEAHSHGNTQNNGLSADLTYPKEKHIKNLKQMTFGGDNAEAYWSFDDELLVFQVKNKEWGAECDQIYLLDPSKEIEKGKVLPLLSTGFGRTTCSYFMPGNKSVLYASTHLGDKACPPEPPRGAKYVWPIYESFDIFVADLEGNITKQLTSHPGYDAEATVSPKGDNIVFTSTRSGDLELWTMDIDGSNKKQITFGLGYDGGAFFSPDGTKLIFRSSRPQTDAEIKEYKDLLAQGLVQPTEMELFICNVDGSDLRQITDLGYANWAPFFHPSGEKVIFSSNHKSKGFPFNLFMINIDGTGLQQITFDNAFDSFPMFSHDGKKLAFSSNRNNGGTRDTNLFIADWVEDK